MTRCKEILWIRCSDMKFAISAEKIRKSYRLGTLGYRTFGSELRSFFSPRYRAEDNNLESLPRCENGFFHALRGVSFEVPFGCSVGLIGGNGAGKSTLLKILSRITEPTSGRAEIRGRVGSLLEVGTGFHPELTGRENIYLNGAILGMRKKEIVRRFDEIVDFSGVEKFLDTPVKRYSSGMYVRLAFAVAAHLDTEVLFVDEVLAVGDSEFQAKCLGKMGKLSSDGRTILFVSHNMSAVRSLCSECIWISDGTVRMRGKSADIVDEYLRHGTSLAQLKLSERTDWTGMGGVVPDRLDFVFRDDTGGYALSLAYHTTNGDSWMMPRAVIDIRSADGVSVIGLDSVCSGDIPLKAPESGCFEVTLPKDIILRPGKYICDIRLIGAQGAMYVLENACVQEISPRMPSSWVNHPSSASLFMIPQTWSLTGVR